MINELTKIQNKRLFRQYLLRCIPLFVMLFYLAWATWDLLVKHDSTAFEAMIFFIIISLILIIPVLRLKFKRRIDYQLVVEEFCVTKTDPSLTQSLIEHTWQNGYRIGAVRYDDHFIVIAHKNELKLLSTKDIAVIDLRMNEVNHFGKASLSIYLKNGSKYSTFIYINEKQSLNDFKAFVLNRMPTIVFGFNQTIYSLLKAQNWDELEVVARIRQEAYKEKANQSFNRKTSRKTRLSGGLLLYVLWVFFSLFVLVMTFNYKLEVIEVIQRAIGGGALVIKYFIWMEFLLLLTVLCFILYLIFTKKSLSLLKNVIMLQHILMIVFVFIHYSFNLDLLDQYGIEYMVTEIIPISITLGAMQFSIIYRYISTSPRVEDYFAKDSINE